LHLHRHNFEITNLNGKATSGIIKDVVDVPRFSDAAVDSVANNPGASLFHGHMLLHMDFGFKALVKYIWKSSPTDAGCRSIVTDASDDRVD
jgi:hypothetical protein